MMTNWFVRMALTALRHILTAAGGGLVGDGFLTNDQSQQAVGAVMTLVGIAWAAYQAHSDHKNAQTVKAYTDKGYVETAPLPPVAN